MKKQLFPLSHYEEFVVFVNNNKIDTGTYSDAYVEFKQKQKSLNIYKS